MILKIAFIDLNYLSDKLSWINKIGKFVMDWDNFNDSINQFVAYSFINDKILNDGVGNDITDWESLEINDYEDEQEQD